MSNEIQQSDVLKYALENGIISMDDILNNVEDMERKKILEQHPFNIWQSESDGRWKTYIPDDSKPSGRVLKAKSSQKDIEQVIVEDFRSREIKESNKDLTLRELYIEWIKFKTAHTKSSSYVKRISADWVTFYESDKNVANQKIKNIDSVDLDEWIHNMIKKHDMTKKKYYNMSIIIRQGLDYAVQKGYIEKNPYDNVKVNKKLFVKSKKKSSESQVFLVDEKPKIIQELQRRLLKSPDDATPLAIMMTFETGVRIGELVAIKLTDIKDNYVHIQRQEVRRYEQVDEVKLKFVGFEVVEYTKSDDGDREVYLTKTARDIIQEALDIKKRNGWDCDDYLFVRNNQRINHYGIQAKILKACKAIGIEDKTMHKIRKTYISSLIDGGVNIDEIRKQVGHSDERTSIIRERGCNRKARNCKQC